MFWGWRCFILTLANMPNWLLHSETHGRLHHEYTTHHAHMPRGSCMLCQVGPQERTDEWRCVLAQILTHTNSKKDKRIYLHTHTSHINANDDHAHTFKDIGAFLYRHAHSLHHKSYNPGPWCVSRHPGVITGAVHMASARSTHWDCSWCWIRRRVVHTPWMW